jgi:nucleoside-diphosphate-sugar epimerase
MTQSFPDALIGHSGFVGSNVLAQRPFAHLYNSKNIEAIQGQEFDLVVCAAAYGTKWKANKEPEADLSAIERLMHNLAAVRARNFVLISTIDVYPEVNGVDEDAPVLENDASSYGRHRRLLEKFVESRFDATIIRLPGLFGTGLKKNIIYDFMHGARESVQQDGLFQFYYLDFLWQDIHKALANKLRLINFATEPITVRELAKKVFHFDFMSNVEGPAPCYDMHTKYGYLWGHKDPYLYSRAEVIKSLRSFVDRSGTD